MVLHIVGIAVDIVFDNVIRRIVAKQRVFVEIVHRVKAKAIHAAIKPKAQHAFHIGDHLGIAIVEVGLLGQERVHVILLAPRIPRKGRPAKHRQPVARRRAIGARIDPDVPIGLGARAAGAALGKERVLVGTMVQHLIDDHLKTQLMGAHNQRVKILQRAKDRINIGVVGHIIAHVQHGRGEEG